MARLLETALCCPACLQSFVKPDLTKNELSCPCGMTYPLEDGIPNFIHPETLLPRDAEALHQYDEAAEEYDEMIKWLFQTFHGDELEIRTRLVDLLEMKKGSSVLEVSCGTGSNLFLILERVGDEGNVAALDLSREMLRVARVKLGEMSDKVAFVQANAAYIPFCNQMFDAVLHLGGINSFGDIKRSISEMTRVTKIGGHVVIGDQGLAPWLKDTEYGKTLIKINPLYDNQPPLQFLPENARDVRVHWFIGNAFYLLEFKVGESSPQLNLDLPLPGRNDTLRSLVE